MTRIAMVAGEASGDLLAAHLIGALRRRLPDAEFCGIGGPKMQAAGFDAWWPAEKLAVMGYAEVLRHYREITGIRRQLLARLLDQKPDIFIGVDAPDFNLWLESRLKRKGIPTVHYVGPTVWAWRGRRIARIRDAVSHMLVMYPFEPEIYARNNIPATYVGHPLADMIPLERNQAQARDLLEIDRQRKVFALLPGSRMSEVGAMSRLFVDTALLLQERFPGALFLVPMVSRETRHVFETALWEATREWRNGMTTEDEADALPFRLMFGHAQEALAACDGALVASGTATLQAALLKTPMVIAYKMSRWSWALMNRMRYQPWVGQPNILAGRFVVPEFLQDDATPDNLAQALGNLVIDPETRAGLTQLFTGMHRQLRQNTAEKAADAVLSLLPQ